jgi:tRNA threonylcarbamoyladenosine modification (KEOPS) complex  Pcc1 subunit
MFWYNVMLAEAAMPDLKTLYEEDTVAWSEQQAAALRAAARTGSNQFLDWENLAEEIESLGKSVRLGLRRQIARIIQHEVKLEHSPAVDPRSGWRHTIRQARVEIERILEDSPSLRREVPRLIQEETGRAVRLAISDMEEHGELDRLELPTLRKASFTEEQILGDWFPEEPRD